MGGPRTTLFFFFAGWVSCYISFLSGVAWLVRGLSRHRGTQIAPSSTTLDCPSHSKGSVASCLADTGKMLLAGHQWFHIWNCKRRITKTVRLGKWDVTLHIDWACVVFLSFLFIGFSPAQGHWYFPGLSLFVHSTSLRGSFSFLSFEQFGHPHGSGPASVNQR
jgi:hypothetical protein